MPPFIARFRMAARRGALAAIVGLLAQTGAPAEEASQPDADPIQIPSGGRPFTVDRIDDIPRQLNAAIGRVQCRLDADMLKDTPIQIFRPADGLRVMAVVPCRAIVKYSRAFVFDRSIQVEPSPMTFPIIAASGGFSASELPGLMSWNAETRTLTAWRIADHCPAREIRHSYRQGLGELNGFALARVEFRDLRCTTPETDWKTVWQASPWPAP
jgi:hypothetical protein